MHYLTIYDFDKDSICLADLFKSKLDDKYYNRFYESLTIRKIKFICYMLSENLSENDVDFRNRIDKIWEFLENNQANNKKYILNELDIKRIFEKILNKTNKIGKEE
jgi:hypothetical protein